MFTREHYGAVALILNRVLRSAREPESIGTIRFLMSEFADAFKHENDNFSRQRFIDACTQGIDA